MREYQIWDFVHEAGHVVAAELRGALPEKVRFEDGRLVVAAGYAAALHNAAARGQKSIPFTEIRPLFSKNQKTVSATS